VPSLMNRANLRAYARLGAMRRLEELKQEEAAIRAAFPDLFRPGRRARKAAASTAAAPKRRRRRRAKMSAAQRRAVSVRMKKYWADRRKAKGMGHLDTHILSPKNSRTSREP